MDVWLTILLLLANTVSDVQNPNYLCMTTVIYGEAASETLLGKAMVGQVVLNRVDSPRWGNDVCTVVQQSKQFAGYRPPRIRNAIDARAWFDSAVAAQYVMSGGRPVFSDCADADHFHESTHRPAWSRSMQRVCRVDNHTFYRSR